MKPGLAAVLPQAVDGENTPWWFRRCIKYAHNMIKCQLRIMLIGVAFCGAVYAASPVYPVKISANGRYLMDQNNVPFLMVGDAPHSLVVNLSSSNAAIYLADRAT
ncbi:MAG: hypothetical protein WBN22_03645, partial [Verrucomicrobiia bacterium]